MPTEIWTALIGALAVAIPSVLTTVLSNRANQKIMEYKIQQLSDRVEKHNSVIERTYKLEKDFENSSKIIDMLHDEINNLQDRINK